MAGERAVATLVRLPATSLTPVFTRSVRVRAGTLFDGTEYRRFLTEMELLQDRKGLLTREGLHAYYEVCGRLKDDIRGLGVGSLNETVAGKIKMSAAYEPECVSTLLPLAECGHTLSQQLWKRVIAAVSSLFEVSADSDFQSLEHALDMIFHILTALGVPLHGVDREVKAGIREPGWVAKKLHEVSAWLADGRDGVIRSLRKTALADHGRFDQFHHIFTVRVALTAPLRPNSEFPHLTIP